MTIKADREPSYTIECDRCGELAKSDGTRPAGWTTVDVWTEGDTADPSQQDTSHLCSVCRTLLIAFLGDR